MHTAALTCICPNLYLRQRPHQSKRGRGSTSSQKENTVASTTHMTKRARPRPSLVVILDLSAATVTLARLGKHHTYCKCNDDITPPCRRTKRQRYDHKRPRCHTCGCKTSRQGLDVLPAHQKPLCAVVLGKQGSGSKVVEYHGELWAQPHV